MTTAFENALKDLLPALQAVPKEALRKMDMPAHAVPQDALYTYKWCQTDKGALTARRLDWDLVESIPVRVMAFEEAQSNWNNVRFGREEAMKLWKAESPAGYSLRDDLLSEFNYAFRNDVGLQTRVDAVAEGSGDADMIQDLNDLVVIGRENPAPLRETAFDFGLLDRAAVLCERLGALRADASVDKVSYREQKLIRDRAYTYLMAAVDALRECGRFVFRKDGERLDGYASQYRQAQRSRSSAQTEAEIADALSAPTDVEAEDASSKSA